MSATIESDPAASDADSARSNDGGLVHIPALDGVRGIAILMVVVYHFFRFPVTGSTLKLDAIVMHVTELGWAGVDLFFVLSGFLITRILLEAKEGTHYFRAFYARRFLRIFPVYYGMLIVIVVVLPAFTWFARDPGILALKHTQVWYWTYLYNIRVPLEPFQDYGGLGGHLWSLAIEEQFYLVWPAVILLCNRRWAIRVCLACIISALLFRIVLVTVDIPRVIVTFAPSMFTPARMDTLALGALIAVLSTSRQGLVLLRRWAPAAMTVAVIALLAIAIPGRGLPPFDNVVRTAGFSALAVLFGGFIVLALTARVESRLNRSLTHPALTVFGRYSYGLYVIHLPVCIFMLRWYYESYSFPLVAGSGIPSRVVFAVVGIGLSMLIAFLSWQLYEKQVLKLKRYFPYGRASAPPEQAERRTLEPSV